MATEKTNNLTPAFAVLGVIAFGLFLLLGIYPSSGTQIVMLGGGAGGSGSTNITNYYNQTFINQTTNITNNITQTADLSGYTNTVSLNSGWANRSELALYFSGNLSNYYNRTEIDDNFVYWLFLLNRYYNITQVDSLLANRVTNSSVQGFMFNSSMAGYMTNSTMANYATNTSVSNLNSTWDKFLQNNYTIINASIGLRVLNTTLANYVTNSSVTGFMFNNSMAPYALNVSLINFMFNASMAGYMTNSTMANYVVNGTLANYVTNSTLANYMTNVSMAPYATNNSLIAMNSTRAGWGNCTAGQFVTGTFNGSGGTSVYCATPAGGPGSGVTDGQLQGNLTEMNHTTGDYITGNITALNNATIARISNATGPRMAIQNTSTSTTNTKYINTSKGVQWIMPYYQMLGANPTTSASPGLGTYDISLFEVPQPSKITQFWIMLGTTPPNSTLSLGVYKVASDDNCGSATLVAQLNNATWSGAASTGLNITGNATSRWPDTTVEAGQYCVAIMWNQTTATYTRTANANVVPNFHCTATNSFIGNAGKMNASLPAIGSQTCGTGNAPAIWIKVIPI